jgi:hypothetical protein
MHVDGPEQLHCQEPQAAQQQGSKNTLGAMAGRHALDDIVELILMRSSSIDDLSTIVLL